MGRERPPLGSGIRAPGHQVVGQHVLLHQPSGDALDDGMDPQRAPVGRWAAVEQLEAFVASIGPARSVGKNTT